MKIWVRACFDYNLTKKYTDGAFEILDNYFQFNNLNALIVNNGLLWTYITNILDDMNFRYGYNDRINLANLQWANASMTRDLPLDLGSVPTTSEMKYHSFLALNATFSFLPEI